MKLADSALSRDLFPSDYHCLGDNENRPIKWMPMEAIAHKKYSKASDVVSRRVSYQLKKLNKHYKIIQVVLWCLLVGTDDPSPTTFLGYRPFRNGIIPVRRV